MHAALYSRPHAMNAELMLCWMLINMGLNLIETPSMLNVIVVAAGSHFESVTLGNVTMSHRTRGPPNALRLSHSTMIGLPRA
ncbi:hypothetical protein EVAR_67538_1 [Eumeta japonica]|uniref:Uncharacterized protein n=1 Tax=Eumeta variegata TaxID=151549 RepID=A0A4C2A018_EUMVA|nr:hypothetical protein EVAR_67538_1 [Eumeta japonica]